ncbi:hypothetical protein [Halorientalis salina]|uniref:hypothetical protein n=1 Tax=Halorientalis salina TaxID=2932266 RepID=UPI0010AB63F1|nr:hypothetical protein [Halorientalis salina]
MTYRTKAEQIVVVLGAVVAVVALALLGLAAYATVGPAGLSGSYGVVFGGAVFVGLAVTILYASSGVRGLFEREYRRRT